jgi:hypothetical protein
MSKHTLPTDSIQKILNYLKTKAYGEVSDLVTEILTKAEPVADSKPEASVK